jgi:DNA-damage-inducible protein J
MASATINVRTDGKTKAQAMRIFESLGMDMTTAVNVFLRQTVRDKDFPFVLTTNVAEGRRRAAVGSGAPVRRKPRLGGMKGKIWMADDFDAPMDDVAEHS